MNNHFTPRARLRPPARDARSRSTAYRRREADARRVDRHMAAAVQRLLVPPLAVAAIAP